MQNITPFLQSQNDILNSVRTRQRDGAKSRWSDTEVYTAINSALLEWQSKVTVPHLYTIPGGWVAGQYDYTLPNYIKGAIDPQQKRFSSNWLYVSGSATEADTWADIQAFEVVPDGFGGQTLRLGYYPTSGDGQVIWWAHNGPVPLTVPTLNTTIDADDTSLVLASVVDVDDAGYIKIGSEWTHYAGRAEGTSTVTLSGLIRGINGTTAASHNSGVSVYWGIAAHRSDLYQQLYDRVRSELHALYLTDAAESEKAHHERLMMFYDNKANNFWRSYAPNRAPKLRFDRRMTGDLPEETASNQMLRQ